MLCVRVVLEHVGVDRYEPWGRVVARVYVLVLEMSVQFWKEHRDQTIQLVEVDL